MRQLMRYLQKLPEEGPLSLMVDGKIIPCKSISITEDLVMVTASDDTVWYLDPDRIAGFSSDFLGEGMALEEEILPSMHPHEGEGGRSGAILVMPRWEGPRILRETVLALYPMRPLGTEELEMFFAELDRLDTKEVPATEKRDSLLSRISSCEVQYPECARGFLCLRACYYSLTGEPRKAAALFLKAGRGPEALAVLEHQEGYKSEAENRLLVGYVLLNRGEEHMEGEEVLLQRYAQLCEEDSQMGLFSLLRKQRGELGKAGEEATLFYLERKHPERRYTWESDDDLFSYLDLPEQELSREECEVTAKALLQEAPEPELLPEGNEESAAMVFYVSTVKSRSYAGYQQAHLFFRRDVPQEGEERRYQEVYLNPRQVLDPLLGEILQRGTEMDLSGLRIVFTPILNDKGVAGGDAFLAREDRGRVYAQACREAPRWCRHDIFIRYGARPYVGASLMEEAFTKAACDAHEVKDEACSEDWQVLRFLRMALCEDVEGAPLPAVYGREPKVRHCALALTGASTKEEKNLWISRLFYWLQETGQEEQALLLEYFLFGLPGGNAFHMDKDLSGKISKEALWVKMQSMAGSLRLFAIPQMAGQWRNAMLRDRRVKDASALSGSHARSWEKVSLLEKAVGALLAEEGAAQAVQALGAYLSDSEKEKCRPFLAFAESMA